MMYVCRCGDDVEVGQVTAELTLQADNGSETAFLCAACNEQAWRFMRNETAAAVLPALKLVPDDEDYDDLSIPVDVESEDWQRELKRPA